VGFFFKAGIQRQAGSVLRIGETPLGQQHRGLDGGHLGQNPGAACRGRGFQPGGQLSQRLQGLCWPPGFVQGQGLQGMTEGLQERIRRLIRSLARGFHGSHPGKSVQGLFRPVHHHQHGGRLDQGVGRGQGVRAMGLGLNRDRRIVGFQGLCWPPLQGQNHTQSLPGPGHIFGTGAMGAFHPLPVAPQQ